MRIELVFRYPASDGRRRDAGGWGLAIRFQSTRMASASRSGTASSPPRLDCPIIAPAEVVEIYRTGEVLDSSEWDLACQQGEGRWTSLLRGEH